MCGICGVYDLTGKPPPIKALQAMSDRLAHRGPDGAGLYSDGAIGLAHRRLAIIDLATGQQPMTTPDESLVITFNGEIYNFIELRRELELLGCRFRTSSDTEVILHGYQTWGLDCFRRLNGMWALALWDAREKKLVLCRDRLGEKPLYYAVHDRAVVFASEIKSLLAYGVPATPRLDLLELYLTLGFIPAPNSFYREIYKLRAGHYLLARRGEILERAYWSLPQVDEGDLAVDNKRIHAEFADTLEDAVKLRMRADVPFGAFLSGGLDSASVVSLMSRFTSHPVRTFTMGFSEAQFDERERARSVATAFSTDHHEYELDPSSYDESLARVLEHYDEPFGDSSAIATGYLCRFARQHVKMVLTGDGGDEALSGYTAYQGELFSAQYQELPAAIQTALPRVIARVATPFRGRARYSLNRAHGVCLAASASFEERLARKLAFTDLATIRRMTTHMKEVWPIEDYIADTMRPCRYRDPFYRLMYFNLLVTLPDNMLVKVDRMSMAASLETRMPFLDYRLIELLALTAKRIKMPRYTRKAILLETVGKSLPRAIRKAPKRGFVVPLREWFKDASLPKLERLDSLKEATRIPAAAIRGVIEDNRIGRADNGNFLWTLAVLDGWLEKSVRA